MNRITNIYLNIVVFISGAAVLAIEILGTRILGPFYGVSLYLWSALITVTLAALSLGYVIGGRWADKTAKVSRLSIIVGSAGLWLLVIPWIKQPVLLITETFGLRIAVLIAAFILFSPPLVMLGMVGPYIIRLKISNIAMAGRTAGDVYAISTVASVLSAVLTGFILIPNFGLARLTVTIGIILLLTASLGLIANIRSRLFILIFTLCLLVSVIAAWKIPDDKNDSVKGLLTVRQSAYAEIRVADISNTRHMIIDGATHTFVNLSNWGSLLGYVPVMHLNNLIFENPGKLLLIGLGGGSLVKSFYNAGWEIDAVEIDPVVTELAFKYFGLEQSEGNIFHADGRQFLKYNDKKYDLIILDAYGSGHIPFHLVTEESFALIKSRLNKGGVVAVNIFSVGWRDEIVNSIAKTVNTQFKEVIALPVARQPDELGNLVMLASDRKIDFSPNKLPSPRYYYEKPYKRWFVSEMNHAWSSGFTPEKTDETILFTDDLNPVDIMGERINYEDRKRLHKYYEEEGLSW